mmetsp:Transcript_111589/g.311926  ORF Transcript_111589/g.311926 Transcript_111589/m.311926 type:complete len:630 (+) Transcript_111589:132-2021(+)|eukprot:CAMPEP_0176233128 /NCGR_PEP_ID=MMETSP0121_2-20121125/25661_1 /TAXON_ID=160619 /ORGANISM="Kryptoperidinium foliaceum, Strain CCMP 1326" /LENGTH=629 /DNA_ID=CAMNT_0017572505 /DNA_START=20 /DNA_END=1909 /DNA_ORIENTATION=-
MTPESLSPIPGRKSKSEAKVFAFIDRSNPVATLSWEGLGYAVQAQVSRKVILRNVSGELRPGELTCILGPSGSGKTSLLNILAGRVRRGGGSEVEIPGRISLNGRPIDPSGYQQLFGYVMQDDALLGTMTPREVLRFSARLRLEHTGESIEGLVQDLLHSMGLAKCADTMVGSALIKGISGGERKRTAVGAELITNPQITFLDEPTSGLDTGASYDVICLLGQLARMGRSVMCTIHQPSSEVFQLFDQSVFLVRGEVAYRGPPSGIRSHFARLGLTCPSDYNPADFVIFCIQSKDEAQLQRVVQAWPRSLPIRPAAPGNSDAELPIISRRKGFCLQLSALAVREARNVLRDKSTLRARFGSTILLTTLFGVIFFQIGSPDAGDSALVDRAAYDLQSHYGALTMLGMSCMMSAAQPLLLTFAGERPVFIREYASNLYGTLPYFLSKTAMEVPLLATQVMLQWLIAYWLMGMRGHFLVHYIGSLLISITAASTALLAACLVKDAKQALELAPALFVSQILFAGMFIKIDLIPVWMRWIQYACSLKWGMNILMQNEFHTAPSGAALLLANDVDASDVWIYYIVLFGIAVGFRSLAAIALSRKAKAFYNGGSSVGPCRRCRRHMKASRVGASE